MGREDVNQLPVTSSGLRGDGVRGLSRLLRRAKAVVGQNAPVGPQVFRRRVRRARRLRRPLHRWARQKGEAATAQLPPAYERLLAVARTTQAHALRGCTLLRTQTVPRVLRRIRPFDQVLPRVERVINPTVRRVLQGEVVSAQAKLVRLFEPHTQSIV